MLSFTEENYLKAIYKLSAIEESVSTNAIAEKLSTKAASVTDMLKRLYEKGFINYQKYKGVSLTEDGKVIAIKIVRRHRLWETFLVSKLGFTWDEVHPIAEELEHVSSDSLTEKLDSFLGYPKYDPHGDPIPNSKGIFKSNNNIGIKEMKAKKQYVVHAVTNHDPLYLKHLSKLNLQIGATVELMDTLAFDESLMIKTANGEVYISKQVAEHILVSEK